MGNWTYLYFTASDEGESSGYFFKIFAYNDVTHSVRYIIAYSLEELEPYYRTRYKNEFCCINTPKMQTVSYQKTQKNIDN